MKKHKKYIDYGIIGMEGMEWDDLFREYSSVVEHEEYLRNRIRDSLNEWSLHLVLGGRLTQSIGLKGAMLALSYCLDGVIEDEDEED